MQLIYVAFAVFAVLAIGEPVAGQAIHPQWSWSNGDIVYYHREGNAAGLWRLDPKTGEKEALINDGTYNGNPTWSPDGKEIAFTSARPDMRGSWQIYRRNLEAGEDMQLTNLAGRVMHPSWSPDGKWIAHVRMADGKSDVWLISADGKEERRVTETAARDFHPKWAGDSKHLVFDTGPDEARVIHVLNIETGAVQVIEGPHGLGAGVPAVSQDGSQVVFSCRSETVAHMCRWQATSGAVELLAKSQEGQSYGGFFFNAAGTEIAFHKKTKHGYAVYKMDLETRTEVMLAH